jgi:hypothetical protein
MVLLVLLLSAQLAQEEVVVQCMDQGVLEVHRERGILANGLVYPRRVVYVPIGHQ